MTYSEFQKHYSDIQELVIDKRLREAIQILSKLIVHINSSEIQNRFQSISDTFRNMLKYSFGFAPDPERNTIFRKLQQSILELSDDIREHWYRSMNLFERKAAIDKIAQFEALYIQDSIQLVSRLSMGGAEEADLSMKNELASQTFYYLWLKSQLRDESISLFWKILDHDDVENSIKELMVSAITMSQLRHFDSKKFILLFELAKNENIHIRQRAMIGLFISILVYRKRIMLYPNLVDRLKSIPDDSVFQERMLALLLQFIRASETEKITRKIQEEIVPEVMKMQSELEDKLNLGELLSKENFEEKNPEWENFFKDAPDVYQKLEQFSKMQIEGADVFMGAFAMLKHFPFFKGMSNWFLPFKASNPEIHKAFEGVDDGVDIPVFLEGLEESTVLCNSDKYSFCLNIQHMPAQQRKMILELFNMELKAMNEMMEDEFKLNVESKNKIINTQYFQDLYRFFKLHPYKKEYTSLFDMDVSIFDSEALMILFEEPKILRNLAEFYFAQDRYEDARILFIGLSEKEQSFELFEKLGFCSQKLGDFAEAIDYYKQAELFDKNKVWLQKKLGFCYRKIGEYQLSIDYYKEIIKSEPKDLNNLAYLGQLHIDIEDYEEALKYYYKVEYETPDNPKVFRPIGWCSFVLGKYDTAIKYFEKIVQQNPIKSDYLNIGHCHWISGNIEQALDVYREAVRISGRDEAWFKDAFTLDSKYLKKSGITDLDITLIIDYVLLG